MAKIVLGIGSSHGPQLEMPPENWAEYGSKAFDQSNHWFGGQTYSYPDLLAARAGDHFDKECNEDTYRTRFNACQQAIAHLAQTLGQAAPDVCIMFGDDQHEAFGDDNMPSFAIYHGETVLDGLPPSGHRANLGDARVANRPAGPMNHPTDARLGEYLIESLIENEFDVTRTNKLPSQRDEAGAIGHAFYYIYRRLMDNRVISNVPIMVNTYYPPNAPTARRCYKFGQAVRQAIEAWDSTKRVAIFASGGLSHTVIEEDFDQEIIDGLKHDDVEKLTEYPDVRFRAGTSEIKNWVALGGAMSGTGLAMNLVDYVPCYRTAAGNGCAMGFAEWM